MALSPVVYGAEVWQEMLEKAWTSASADVRQKAELARMHDLIASWNRRCDADSTGAIAYKYWKDAFGDEVKKLDEHGFCRRRARSTIEAILAKLAKARRS